MTNGYRCVSRGRREVMFNHSCSNEGVRSSRKAKYISTRRIGSETIEQKNCIRDVDVQNDKGLAEKGKKERILIYTEESSSI